MNFAHALSKLLSAQKQLSIERISRLDLSRNHLRDEGISILAPVIAASTSIIYLSLANNEFGIKGLGNLCSCMKLNQSIVYLDISNHDALLKNRFTWHGGKIIADMLNNTPNSVLSYLNI